MTKIHIIGVGGSGMSAIARVLQESGNTVSGSDRVASPAAEKLRADGVRVLIGHQAGHIKGAELVLRSSAIPDDNPEVVAAKAAGIPVLKRAEYLGKLMAGKRCIAVAGSHGKTTTTAMIAWILVEAGKDPSYIIGGVSKNLGSNAHAGKGSVFVIEADEYDRMFLGLTPHLIVITNIEYDHPDVFPTPEIYRQAFIDFAGKLDEKGELLACHDDPGSDGLVGKLGVDSQFEARVASYGIDPWATYQASQVKPNRLGGSDFVAFYQPRGGDKVRLAEVSLSIPGEHNVRNALGALAAAHRLGLSMEKAGFALQSFTGTARRFEVAGEAKGVTLIDDYAHHPTEIRATLAAARARYPGRRIWAVWQPHTYSRTQALRDEFLASFAGADRVIVTDIYAAREPAAELSSASLAAAMAHPAVDFVPSLGEVVSSLLSRLAPGDVVLVLSAGDADQVTAQVLAALQK